MRNEKSNSEPIYFTLFKDEFLSSFFFFFLTSCCKKTRQTQFSSKMSIESAMKIYNMNQNDTLLNQTNQMMLLNWLLTIAALTTSVMLVVVLILHITWRSCITQSAYQLFILILVPFTLFCSLEIQHLKRFFTVSFHFQSPFLDKNCDWFAFFTTWF